jgi:hypothetical protein
MVTPATPAPSGCLGDCDGDGQVRIDELLRGVAIGLGAVAVETCALYACPAPGCVIIQVLISSVEHALRGCPPPPATATHTAIATHSATPTRTPHPDALIAALGRVIDAECTWDSPGPFLRGAYALDGDACDGVCIGGYAVTCAAAHGHSSDATLRRHRNAADALRTFAAASTAGEAVDFRDLPAAYWEQPFFLGGADRFLVWRLDCWVVTAHSFDDTHFRIAAQPRPFSEAILAEMEALLRAACE